MKIKISKLIHEDYIKLVKLMKEYQRPKEVIATDTGNYLEIEEVERVSGNPPFHEGITISVGNLSYKNNFMGMGERKK